MSLLTVLNFSAGRQSSCLLWMVLLGDLDTPDNFIVLSADPGMEDSRTYEYREMMFDRCKIAGIEAYVAPGPNLYEDLTNISPDQSHLDNPPYYTLDEDWNYGKLRHKCTEEYKIRPMDRFIRHYMEEHFGIHHNARRGLGTDTVEKWIGFSYDEVERVKRDRRNYIKLSYPLIDMKMTIEDVEQYYEENNLPVPPRSACNACFANGTKTFYQMWKNRPSDWKQAVEVDESIRDLSNIGVNDEVYVHNKRIPLTALAELKFEDPDPEDMDNWACTSGHCFI